MGQLLSRYATTQCWFSRGGFLTKVIDVKILDLGRGKGNIRLANTIGMPARQKISSRGNVGGTIRYGQVLLVLCVCVNDRVVRGCAYLCVCLKGYVAVFCPVVIFVIVNRQIISIRLLLLMLVLSSFFFQLLCYQNTRKILLWDRFVLGFDSGEWDFETARRMTTDFNTGE